MNYRERILELAPAYDPRHVEGFMRCSCGGTLDHLDESWFRREVRIAVGCIRTGGMAFAEKIAKSYGL